MTPDEQLQAEVEAIRRMYEAGNPELVDLRCQHGSGRQFLSEAFRFLDGWSQANGDSEDWPDAIRAIWQRHGILPGGSDHHRQALSGALSHDSMQTNLLDQIKEGSA